MQCSACNSALVRNLCVRLYVLMTVLSHALLTDYIENVFFQGTKVPDLQRSQSPRHVKSSVPPTAHSDWFLSETG